MTLVAFLLLLFGSRLAEHDRPLPVAPSAAEYKCKTEPKVVQGSNSKYAFGEILGKPVRLSIRNGNTVTRNYKENVGTSPTKIGQVVAPLAEASQPRPSGVYYDNRQGSKSTNAGDESGVAIIFS